MRSASIPYLEALDGLGFALEALGDDAGAVAKYQEAIRLNEARGGQFASAHVNLSAFFNRTGDPAKAIEYARKAIELDPKSDRAWFQKGKADEREGRLDDAVAALNTAISVQPAGVLLLLRAGRREPANGLDRREPQGAGALQAPRSRSRPPWKRSVAAQPRASLRA